MRDQQPVGFHARRRARFTARALAPVLAVTVALAFPGPCGPAGAAEKPKTPSTQKTARIEIGFSVNELPVNVAEMREAILAAALSGNLKELMIPVQWNELPPDFGAKPVKDTLDAWRKASHDGSGREMLALIANILTAPYAVRRQGADIENAKIFIWPAFAELALDKLTPPLEVALLRLVPLEDVKRMKAAGRYDGYGLAIGADGTWHAFKRVRESQGASKK